MDGFAVVELKYTLKKTFVVPISWIKNYVRGHSPTVEFFCYISTNLNDAPNFVAKYYMKFTGAPGLFKVFVLTVTDSVLDALSYQEQKRIKSVPQKYRQPANTDVELNAEHAKRKKKENIIKKAAKQSAKLKNTAYLASSFASENVSTKGTVQSSVQFTNSVQKYILNDVTPNANPESRMHRLPVNSPIAPVAGGAASLELEAQNPPTILQIVSAPKEETQLEIGIQEKPMSDLMDSTSISSNVVLPSAISSPSKYAFTLPIDLLSDVASSPSISNPAFPTTVSLPLPPSITLPMYAATSPNVTLQTSVVSPSSFPLPSNSLAPPPIGLSSDVLPSGIVIPPSIVTLLPNYQQPAELTVQTSSAPFPSNVLLSPNNSSPSNTDQIELSIAPNDITSAQSDIVQLAVDGLDLNDIEFEDYSTICNVNTDDNPSLNVYAHYQGIEIPTTTTVHASLNGSDSFNDNDPVVPHNVLLNRQGCQKGNTFPKQGQSHEIDYKHAYLQLKEEKDALEERNLALQQALVAANKALAKVPEVPHIKKDGGRLYLGEVFLTATQCKALDASGDDNKFVNNLVVAVFGTDTLKMSSVTGMPSKNYGFPAKPGLNPLWLQLVYDLVDAKSNKRLTKSEVNKILNKKISNLCGADKRKLEQQHGSGKPAAKRTNGRKTEALANSNAANSAQE